MWETARVPVFRPDARRVPVGAAVEAERRTADGVTRRPTAGKRRARGRQGPNRSSGPRTNIKPNLNRHWPGRSRTNPTQPIRRQRPVPRSGNDDGRAPPTPAELRAREKFAKKQQEIEEARLEAEAKRRKQKRS